MFYKPKSDVQRDAELDAMFEVISELRCTVSLLKLRIDMLELMLKHK